MRLTILLLLVSLFQLKANSSYSQSTRLSLEMREVTVNDVIREIEALSDFKFLYNRNDLDLVRIISIKVKKKRISSILTNVFKGTDVDFQVHNKQIVLKKKRVGHDKEIEDGFESVQTVITGTVSDADGTPLPGASIVEKGTTNGTQSDFDGNFTLSVADANATLVFSYIGFTTQEIALNGQTSITVALVEATEGLDEVVVVGYGVQERKTIAGAVAQINSEVFEDRPVTNTLNALQGAIPGLTVTRGGGQPGEEGYFLNIRGVSTIDPSGDNPLRPLVIVDGIPGSMDLLNPNDIANVSVLKDASASIYGARAAGGVILVTTKRGKKGKPRIELTSSYSINKAANLLDLANLRQWAEMDIEAQANAGGTSDWTMWLDRIDNGSPRLELDGAGNSIFFNTVDLRDIVFETGSQQQYNATVSGGGENTDYLFSAGYVDTDGIIAPAPDDNKRLNLRMNYNFDITDKLRLETRISIEDNKQRETADVHTTGHASGTDRALGSVVGNFVWFPALTEGGNYFGQWGWGSPLGAFDNGIKEVNRQIIRTNFKMSYELADGLSLTGQAGINGTNVNSNNRTQQVPYYTGGDQFAYFEWGTDIPFLYKRNDKTTYRNYTAHFDYNKTFGEKHDVSFTAGASHEESDYEWFFAQRQGFSQDQVFSLNLGGTENTIATGGGEHWAIQSLFSRARYVFDSKYIAEFTFRRDGTSRFSPEQRWGNFYGIIGAWVVSEEGFMKNQNIFDNLKLRASWGQKGNQFAGGLYDYLPNITLRNFNYPFGEAPSATLEAFEAGLVSQKRTWETIEDTNIGFDAGFLDSRLNVRFDYFIKRNKDMLVGVNLPSVLGGTPPSQNIGELETKGWEANVSWNDRTEGGFSYGIGVNIADNTNKLVDLNGADLAGEGLVRLREGYSVNTFFGYDYIGNIQTEAELEAYRQTENVPSNLLGLGDAMFRDINGDGRLSIVDEEGNDADIISYGTTDPRYAFGVNLNAAYKGFDFSAFVQGVLKRTYFYQGDFRFPFVQPWRPATVRFYKKTWAPDRTDAPYPRLSTNDVRWHNWRPSQLLQANGAYARLKNVTVGYSLPNEVMEKIGVERIRLFLSGEDLFTIDALDGGYDPEGSGGDSVYPFTRRFALGINVTL